MAIGRSWKAVVLLVPVAIGPLAHAASDPRAAMTGPIEAVPTLWGDPAIIPPPAVVMPTQAASAAPPVPSSAASPPLPATATALDRALAALDQTQGGNPVAEPPARAASDQISAVVVQARSRTEVVPTVERCITGPAWWRATRGETVVWILATPDRMPMDTVWDDTCLKTRLDGARLLIAPAVPDLTVVDPASRAETPLRQLTKPLSQSVPAALWARLAKRIADNPVRARAEADWARSTPPQGSPPGLPAMSRGIRTSLQLIQDTPNLFAPPIVVAERLSRSLDLPGVMGNPAADRALDLAGRANMLAVRTRNSQAEFAGLTYLSDPAEADQEACLSKVLDALDAGHTGLWRLGQVDAWARGDTANALRRMNVLDTCSLGDISLRFWSALVAQYMELIDKNTVQPGIVVAVVEFDPLMLKGGVLERLTAEGFTVTPPEALQ